MKLFLKMGGEERKREGRDRHIQTHRQHACAVLLNEVMWCTYKDSGFNILAQMVIIVCSFDFGIALY